MKNVRPRDWLYLNWKIGAYSFGGGGRAVYFLDELVVKSKVVTEEEFREAATITQLIPGPNLVNLASYIGTHLVGKWWMLVGLLLLCLPGSLLGILFIEGFDLNNFYVMTLFKGFSLGSIAFFLLYVYQLAKGLASTSDPTRQTHRRKLTVRVLIALLVTILSLNSFPLFWILVIGIPSCVVIEFQKWK